MSKNQVIEYTVEVQKLTPIIKEQVELMKSFADSSKKAYASLPSDFKKQQREQLRLEQENEKLRQQSIKTQQQLEDLAKRQIQTAQANKRLQAQNRREAEAQERAKQRQVRQLEQENSAYLQLQRRWREAQRTLADLIVSQGKNAEATQRARREFYNLDAQIKAVDATTRNYSKNVGNYKSAIGGGLSQLMGAFGVVGGLTAGVSIVNDAIKTIKDFDSGMKNVQKTTGLTKDEVDSLGLSIISLSKELGVVSSVKLTEYATVAGQLGVKGTQNLLKFTEAMAKLETASNIQGEQGASNIARFLTLVDKDVRNVRKFGDEIVNLGNNFATTESEILNTATAIAQNTAIYDLGRKNSLAYATALSAVGVEAELSGSKVGKTLKEMESAILKGGNELTNFAKVSKLTNEEFTTLFSKDKGEAMRLFVNGLGDIKKSGGSVTETLNKLGISEERLQRVLSALASEGGLKTLNEALITVNNSTGAMTAEFETASSKLSEQIGKVGKSWDNFILNLDRGSGVLSTILKDGADGLDWWIKKLDRLVSSSADLKRNMLEAGQVSMQQAVAKRTDQTGENDAQVASQLMKQNLLMREKYEQDLTKVIERHKQYRQGKTTGIETNVEYKRLKNQIDLIDSNNRELDKISKEFLESERKKSEESERLKNEEAIKLNKERTKSEIAESKRRDAELKRLEEERLKASAELKRRELQSDIENEKERSLMLSQNKGQQLLIEMNYHSRLFEVAELNRQENLRQAGDAQHKQLLAWQTYYEEVDKLMRSYNKAELDYQKEVDKQLSDSAKKAMEEAKKDFEARQKIREEEAKRIKQLAEETKNYLSKFTDMGQFGFSSLNIFTDIDEQGNTMFENLLKGAKEWKKQTAVIIGAVGEIAKDVMNAINQASQARFDAEMGRLQVEYETSLMFAGDSTEAKERLAEQYEEKQKELRKKQAKRDKEAAIMTALINTAQAVVGVLAQEPGGLIKRSIAAAIVGAMGMAQVAAIASTPIPEFWTGTDNAPEGLAWTQERGAEVITDKKGNVKTWGHNKGATLTYLNKGDKVYKSHEDYFKEQDDGFNNELNSILASNRISPIIVNNGVTKEEMSEVMQETLGKQPKYSTIVDEYGINTYWQTKDSRQKIKNRSARR